MMSKPAKPGRFLLLLACLALAGVALWAGVKSGRSPGRPLPGTVTFNKHIAPVIFTQCSGCHRPGQPAPFSLLTYADVKKRARQIAEVTAKHYMPPWLPEPGYGKFVGERTLTPQQIDLIQQWVAEGASEGEASDLPPTPKWPDGWQLGKPDLVVTMPEPYLLQPEGKDVYRNFVVRTPNTETKYVRAIEFNPGNGRVVHHTFIRFDRTPESRRRDEQDPGPGFSGLHTPSSAEAPPGHFLSWQPGKRPSKGSDALAWTLAPGTDLVLQMHLQPSGKAESVQASVAFYFTGKPTTLLPFKLGLSSYAIDVPPDKSDYFFEEHFQLPVDVDVISVLPHAHYLAKELQGFATLPNGTRQWLFLIKNWDFNWQGDYEFVHPVPLPKGSVLTMHYVYDNSTNNVRNPNHPPQRVRYGLQASDEMGEMWLQVLAHNTNDLATLEKAYQPVVMRMALAYNQFMLEKDPRDARAHSELGKIAFFQGKNAEATGHFRAAMESQPDYDEPHYFLGLMARVQGRAPEARAEFETALRLNPQNYKAHGNLALMCMEQGNLNEAEQHFQSALRINPADTLARDNLAQILKAKARVQ